MDEIFHFKILSVEFAVLVVLIILLWRKNR